MNLTQEQQELVLKALLEGRQAFINDAEEHGSDWRKYPGDHLKPALELWGYDWLTGKPAQE